MTIELRCRGPLEVRVDGEPPPAELLWRKHLALLVYLARSPRGRAREHLMGLLWPEKDQDKARHSLNEALRVLRRAVGDALVTEGDVVRIEASAIATDLDAGDSSATAGPFLEGFAVPDAPEFEDWLARERERLRATSLEALSRSAEKALAQGDLRAARETAERALALDPQHEPALRALMRAYALDGVRQLALEAYERTRAALERDLGAQPEPATEELARRLRAGDVVRIRPPAPQPEQTPPLVGEGRRLLARLTALWDEAVAGPRIALVQGDPGTGKTRLLDELAARSRLDGAVVAYARALDGDGPRDLVAAWLGSGLAVPELASAAPAALAALAVLDPDLGVRFPGARGAAPLPLDDALTAAVGAIAAERPVLLVLDDAHRAEAATIGSLVRLVQRGGSASLLVALAAPRSGVAAPAAPAALDFVSERIGRDLRGAELHTGLLAEPDVAEFAGWAMPAYSGSQRERLARRVMADTSGNPFLVAELMLALRAGLSVSPGDGAAWPAARRTLDDTLPSQLPPAVAAALRLRYRALSAPAQRLLAALAVLGGRTPATTLARAAEVPRGELERALDQLEWERWIQGDAHGYSFVTRLAREVVLTDMVTGGEQRRIRERAAG
ncbi:MAG: AAA family ATPase [Gemmatimonadetes bacterium]|nr:AAA family ATPase [Gemmatimonadota bacterium]